MIPSFLANVTNVLEKAGDVVTLNTEAEGFPQKTGNKVQSDP